MWSPYYKYYQIRKDNKYSESVDTEYLKSILSKLEGIIPDGTLSFKNGENQPWVTITLINTKDGSYAVHREPQFNKINLIEVITSRRPETNEGWYLNILKNISNDLHWEIILERDDNENDDVLIE